MTLALPMALVMLLGLVFTFRTQPHLFWGIAAGLVVGISAFALNLARIEAQTGSGPGMLGLVDPVASGTAFLFGMFAALAYSLLGIMMRAFSHLRWHPVVFHALALGLAGVMVVSFLAAG